MPLTSTLERLRAPAMRSGSLVTSGENFEQFLARAHQLVEAGYRKLKPSRYHTTDEPSITGELALGIEQALREKSATWMRYWAALEDAPENQEYLSVAKRKKGKHRKRPDIKLRYSGQRENLYIRFEAKLLTGATSYEDLIGLDPQDHGLGRFLARRYGRDDAAGGLLGYVQNGTEQTHSDRVKAAFENDSKRYRMAPDGEWAPTGWKSGPQYCFRTIHKRYRTERTIIILHTFLYFGWRAGG